jgi:hypothetical protein
MIHHRGQEALPIWSRRDMRRGRNAALLLLRLSILLLPNLDSAVLRHVEILITNYGVTITWVQLTTVAWLDNM